MCRDLLRIDTTNPPGNEQAAASYLVEKLEQANLEVNVFESAPGRTNLVTRLKGLGTKPPVLLTAHLDVVEADPKKWRYPPFSGEEAEGCLWGRGAIDMKNMAAMCTSILRVFSLEGFTPSRDIIFAAVADEEAGCTLGSKWLVENHPDLVRAEYAIGESGGFSLNLPGGLTVYPIQVAEKGFCWIRATMPGQSGHGSMPIAENPILKMGKALGKLSKPLPYHPTPWLQNFLKGIVDKQPSRWKTMVKPLARPRFLPSILERMGDNATARGMRALLANTASPTVMRAGEKTNVIPGEAECLIDGRTLPGQSDEDLLRELRNVMGPEVKLEVIKSAPPVVTDPINSPLLDQIEKSILEREPNAAVIPYMIPGFTDAKYFSTLGMRWYGFSPVKIERDSGIRFADMFHGDNERIPIEGLKWGTELLCDVVRSFCQ